MRPLLNSFIDHLRRERKIHRPEAGAELEVEPTNVHPDPTESLALKELQSALLGRLKGRKDEKELKEFVLASSMTTDEGKVNQQMADLLGTSEREVISRRSKILRIAGMKELREALRDGRERNKGINTGDRQAAG
jgi:DNA-directed RNA polymerase specialized sigma24 family protein